MGKDFDMDVVQEGEDLRIILTPDKKSRQNTDAEL